jgi:hypothetical protein
MKHFLLCILALGLWGCQHTRPSDKYALRLHWEDKPTRQARATREVVLPQSHLVYVVDAQPALWEGDFMNAELLQVEEGLCVLLQCNAAGSRELYRQTAANQGGRLVLFINERPLGARSVEYPLSDGNLILFVEIPDSEMPSFVGNLKHTLNKRPA